MKIPQTESSLDDFVENERFKTDAGHTCKCIIACQIEKCMQEKSLSRKDMARMMGTSRAAVARVLDPGNASMSLNTMQKVANVLGKELVIKFV